MQEMVKLFIFLSINLISLSRSAGSYMAVGGLGWDPGALYPSSPSHPTPVPPALLAGLAQGFS